MADLAVRWPGLRHMFAMDSNQAAEYVEFLTLTLAVQPYKAQVGCCIMVQVGVHI